MSTTPPHGTAIIPSIDRDAGTANLWGAKIPIAPLLDWLSKSPQVIAIVAMGWLLAMSNAENAANREVLTAMQIKDAEKTALIAQLVNAVESLRSDIQTMAKDIERLTYRQNLTP